MWDRDVHQDRFCRKCEWQGFKWCDDAAGLEAEDSEDAVESAALSPKPLHKPGCKPSNWLSNKARASASRKLVAPASCRALAAAPGLVSQCSASQLALLSSQLSGLQPGLCNGLGESEGDSSAF